MRQHVLDEHRPVILLVRKDDLDDQAISIPPNIKNEAFANSVHRIVRRFYIFGAFPSSARHVFPPGIQPPAGIGMHLAKTSQDRPCDDVHDKRLACSNELCLHFVMLARATCDAFENDGHLRDGRPRKVVSPDFARATARSTLHKQAHEDFSPSRPMPTVLRVGRFRFFFFSNEGQEPAHIHVRAGSDEAKYWLEPIELAPDYGFN